MKPWCRVKVVDHDFPGRVGGLAVWHTKNTDQVFMESADGMWREMTDHHGSFHSVVEKAKVILGTYTTDNLWKYYGPEDEEY